VFETRDITMTFKRGMRRLALFVGVLGAIAGGLASYFDLQELFEQRARHKTFEQFANSAVVQAERKRLQTPIQVDISAGLVPKQTPGIAGPDPYVAYGGKEIKSGAEKGKGSVHFDMSKAVPISGGPASQNSAEGWVVSDSPVPPPPPGFILDHSEVNKGGIKSIFWAKNYEVKSLETEDGQSLVPEPAPSFWLYLLAVTFPFLGFLAPWGLISALIWVGAGFVETPKLP